MSVRVAGADPGTSSLDLLILDDGRVADQVRFAPAELQADPTAPVRWLADCGPFAVVAGPSGFGLPLIRAADCTERDLALMNLRRQDDPAAGQGVVGFARLLRALCASSLPVVFLPGAIHLSTVPAHRKLNRIDVGTADKVCVAALALQQHVSSGRPLAEANLGVVELGSAFTACLALQAGRVVDGLGGTSGPIGWRSGGAWDGEAAYLLGPLAKADLFAGGVTALGKEDAGRELFRESLLKAVAGLHAITPFAELVLSGQLLETETALTDEVATDLARFAPVRRLASLPGAWVKHAAQGAALLADGLAGGVHSPIVEALHLREASGTVLDWLRYPRAAEVRKAWGIVS